MSAAALAAGREIRLGEPGAAVPVRAGLVSRAGDGPEVLPR